jgi:DNA polymerase (family 10)
MSDNAHSLNNAEIANRLASLAQLLSAQRENPYKIKAYQRAAAKIRTLSESIEELVRDEVDLTTYAGIGEAISGAIQEIVRTGTLGKLEKLRSQAPPELASLGEYPRLDPKRVLRAYKKLGIFSIDALREKLKTGELEKAVGFRTAQHIRQGLTETHAILLYKAHDLRNAVEEFLLNRCGARAAEAVGNYRRCVETIEELAFIVDVEDFAALVAKFERYGGRTPLLSANKNAAAYVLSSGVRLRIDLATKENWGLSLIRSTGSKAHLSKLASVTGDLESLRSKGPFPAEKHLYREFGLSFIAPELREGHDEVSLAAQDALPVLVTAKDICGDLHAHSTSSDGANSIEQMAVAARDYGYEYLGITDHSQSLKIARGVSVEDVWKQIRFIDKLNSRLNGIRILKSAEVDILSDGTLDYPDDLLRELDYTVCSVHSRFALTRTQQTERILRAMDNRYFHILGHATGRLLLKRPGYDIDIERIILHAKSNGCFFEINSSPDRLDLSAENGRLARQAGVKIAISTDAHSVREFATIRYGIEQARRAGIGKTGVLNCTPLNAILGFFKR